MRLRLRRGGVEWSRGGEAAAACRALRRNKRGAAAPARIYSRKFLAANDEDMIGFFPCGSRDREREEQRPGRARRSRGPARLPDTCARFNFSAVFGRAQRSNAD